MFHNLKKFTHSSFIIFKGNLLIFKRHLLVKWTVKFIENIKQGNISLGRQMLRIAFQHYEDSVPYCKYEYFRNHLHQKL